LGKTQRIVGALLIVAAIGLAAYAWMLSKDMAASKPVPMQQVVVAAQRIAAGTVLSADQLQLMGFPSRPAGSYGAIEAVLGKTVPVDLAAGEPLLAERIEGGATPSLKRLQPGERAVAIKVDEVVAVGNRLAPGDLVDVFATFRRNNEEIADSHARLLLSGLRILAFGGLDAPEAKKAGATMRNVADTPRTAVLAVPLADVDRLALAAEAGRLLLALRPLDTAGETPPPPVAVAGNASATLAPTAAALLSAPAQAVSLRELAGNVGTAASRPAANGGAAKRAAPAPTVKVMHGLKETSVRVSMKRNGAGQ